MWSDSSAPPLSLQVAPQRNDGDDTTRRTVTATTELPLALAGCPDAYEINFIIIGPAPALPCPPLCLRCLRPISIFLPNYFQTSVPRDRKSVV